MAPPRSTRGACRRRSCQVVSPSGSENRFAASGWFGAKRAADTVGSPVRVLGGEPGEAGIQGGSAHADRARGTGPGAQIATDDTRD
jgi:hypothetical protein